MPATRPAFEHRRVDVEKPGVPAFGFEMLQHHQERVADPAEFGGHGPGFGQHLPLGIRQGHPLRWSASGKKELAHSLKFDNMRIEGHRNDGLR